MAVHEGERLRQVLDLHGIQQVDFAAAVGVKRQQVNHYIGMDSFKPGAWAKVCDGLAKVGIDPSEIRPVATLHRPKPEDLSPLIRGLKREQLANILRILKADALAKERLEWMLEGMLHSGRDG